MYSLGRSSASEKFCRVLELLSHVCSTIDDAGVEVGGAGGLLHDDDFVGFKVGHNGFSSSSVR